MSIISILFNNSPRIAGYQFDATLEDTFEASVELTRYPVESGVKVNDHRIINPITYYLTGAVSNNQLRPMITDFIGGGLSNLINNNPIVAAVAGMSAGFLAGNEATKSSSTLEFLLQLMTAGLPFDVDAVDIQMVNMVLTKVSRTRDPSNENGLIFVAQLQELINLDRLPNFTQPVQSQLPDGDPSKTAAAAALNRGQTPGFNPNVATSSSVNAVADIEARPL